MILLEIEEYSQDIQKEIGERIRVKRKEREFTIFDIAEYLGIGVNQVSRIEKGKNSCSLAHLYVLSQLLECSVDYFLFGDTPKWMLTKEQRLPIENLLLAFEQKSTSKDEKNMKN